MNKPQIESIRVIIKDDYEADASYLEQKEFEDRLRAFEDGDFNFIGIYAEAVCTTDAGQGCKRLQTFTSGGLWGIESDSDDEYLETIKIEELEDLKTHLENYNVETSNFDNLIPSEFSERWADRRLIERKGSTSPALQYSERHPDAKCQHGAHFSHCLLRVKNPLFYEVRKLRARVKRLEARAGKHDKKLRGIQRELRKLQRKSGTTTYPQPRNPKKEGSNHVN